MFRAFIGPYIAILDVEFPTPNTMHIKSMQFVLDKPERVTYELVPGQNTEVVRGMGMDEHVFSLTSGEDSIRVGIGYHTSSPSRMHQFNFSILDSRQTGKAIRFYDDEFDVVDYPRDASQDDGRIYKKT